MRAILAGECHVSNHLSSLTYPNDRWKSLEAVLAALGSLSEPLLDYIDDEEVSGRPKPIDIESLLANMIPTLLSLSRELAIMSISSRC